MLPILTQIVDAKRCTNKQERTTAVRIMKRSGATDREISNVTGHVRESSLAHYDPWLMTEKSNTMALALSNAGLKKKNTTASERQIPTKQVVVATIHQVNNEEFYFPK